MTILKTLIKIIILGIIVILIVPWLWKRIDNYYNIKTNYYIIVIKKETIKTIKSIWNSFKNWADNPTPKMRNKINEENQYIKELETN
jgi:predicted PurR-regulated permease PerM